MPIISWGIQAMLTPGLSLDTFMPHAHLVRKDSRLWEILQIPSPADKISRCHDDYFFLFTFFFFRACLPMVSSLPLLRMWDPLLVGWSVICWSATKRWSRAFGRMRIARRASCFTIVTCTGCLEDTGASGALHILVRGHHSNGQFGPVSPRMHASPQIL